MMHVANVFLTITLSLGLAAASAATFAAKKEAYKWVDDNGTIHYSAYPPKNRHSERVNTHMGRSEPVPQASSSAAETAENPTDENKAPAATEGKAQQNRKDPEVCARAKTNLATMNRHARVRVKGEDGELRYLSQEEKQQEIQDTENVIEESC